MPFNKHLITAALLGGLFAASTGCQSLGLKQEQMNPLTPFAKDDEKSVAPDRMVATWSEAVLHKSGEGTRGFGGRIYFYERNSAEPQAVEGQLVVYAFEEDNPEVSQETYTKRYVFPPEQFAKHKSESEIGVSYSVWLPWDQVGGDQAAVSLIARFEPLKGGGLVVSDQARQRLPGKPKPPTMMVDQPAVKTPAGTIADNQIEQAGYRTSVEVRDIDSKDESKPKMSATTISLPAKYGRPANESAATLAAKQKAELEAEQQSSQPAVPASEYKPTPIRTSVEYLTPGQSVQKSLQRRSFGSSR